MRLNHRTLKAIYVKERENIVDPVYGSEEEGYSETYQTIKANLQPSSGQLERELYGERINNMFNVLCPLESIIKESDGVCLDIEATEEPNYKVISVRIWNQHKFVVIEKCLV
jgi:hypothetical protein